MIVLSSQTFLGPPSPTLIYMRPCGLRKTTRELGAVDGDGSGAKNITQWRLHIIMIFWSKNWQQSSM